MIANLCSTFDTYTLTWMEDNHILINDVLIEEGNRPQIVGDASPSILQCPAGNEIVSFKR